MINKDHTKQPWRIDMIPNTDKDSIQDWLTDMDISYTEGPMNLNWKSIMGTVAGDDRFYMNTEDDEVTPKEAGWEFLRMQGKDDDTDNSDGDQESDFDSSSESESEDPEDDLDEQGLDWDDMEKKAMAEDRRNAQNSREERGGGAAKSSRGGARGGGGGRGGNVNPRSSGFFSGAPKRRGSVSNAAPKRRRR